MKSVDLVFLALVLCVVGAPLVAWGLGTGLFALLFGGAIAIAALTFSARKLRRLARFEKAHGDPVSLGACEVGQRVTIRGRPAEGGGSKSLSTEDEFPLIYGMCARRYGDAWIPLARDPLGEVLLVEDDTGVARVRLEGIEFHGVLHYILRWRGWGYDAVPGDALRAWLREHGADLSRPPRMKKRLGAQLLGNFRYREFTVRPTDTVTISGPVSEIHEEYEAEAGYRGSHSRVIEIGRDGKEVVSLSIHTPEQDAVTRRRAWRGIAIGVCLLAWGVLAFGIPLSQLE